MSYNSLKTKYGSCCVVPGCSFRSGTNAMSQVKVYRFPRELGLRAKWTQAIRRDAWQPKASSVICSRHFLQGKPSCDKSHPDWIPSIFPSRSDAESSRWKVSRYERLQERRVRQSVKSITESNNMDCEAVFISSCEATHLPFKDASTMTDIEGLQVDEIMQQNKKFNQKIKIMEKKLESSNRKEKALELLNTSLNTSLASTNTERILKNKKQTEFYTGLQNVQVFNYLLAFLVSFWKPKTKVGLNYREQFLLVLMKLRLGLLVKDLAYRFEISVSGASSLFNEWMDVMACNLSSLVKWPRRQKVNRFLPEAFKTKLFENVMAIIDCSELFIEKPSNLHARAQTYSRYKNHNTVKFLIAVTPAGAISFISKAWGGRVSDKQIIKESGLLNLVKDGDVYLADRGFRCDEMFAAKKCKLLIPSFTKGKLQLPGNEVIDSRKLATVRIHVERVIGRLKNFRVLSGILPISLIRRRSREKGTCMMDKILLVCAALTNLQTSVIAGINSPQ